MTTRAFATLLLCFLVTLPAVAQSPEATDLAYQEIINVEVVNVDVYVIDKKGRPVTGLTAENFQLFVDNDPVLLTNFLAVADGTQHVDPLATPASDATPATESNRRVESPEPALKPLHLVLFVDNLNTRPGGRQRVLKQLKKFISRDLQPQDQVMVVNFDRSLNVHLPFTTDHQAVKLALTELLEVPALGFRQDRLRVSVMEQVTAVGCEEGPSFARGFSAQIYADVDSSILALESLIGSLGGLDGKKALFYISDGLQTRAGEEVFYMLAGRCLNDVSRLMAMSSEYDHTASFRQLTAHANSNRVTLFPIEVLGITTPTSSIIEIGPRQMAWTGERGSSSDTAGPASIPLNPGGSPGPTESILDQMMAANRQGSLIYMSEQTGGQAVLNANNVLPDLSRIDGRMRNYYSLGFQRPQRGDGRVYPLRVTVNRPQSTIMYRRSFADLPWEERMADRLQALVAFDGYWDNPLQVDVETLDVGDIEKGVYKAKIRMSLPAAGLLLTPTDDGRQTGSLQLLLASQTDAGSLTNVQRVSFPLAFSTTQLQDHPELNTVHYLEITQRKGSHSLALAVLDEAARIASFVDHSIQTPTN